MPNKDLKHRSFHPTPEVLNTLKGEVSRYQGEGQDKGYKRAKAIVDNPVVSYNQMKRIKTYFDGYEGDGFDDEYKLNGGDTMKKWLEKALGNARDAIHNIKDTQMKGGKENAFKKTHVKDRDNADPTRVRQAKIHKGSKMRNIMNNDTIYETKIEDGTIYEYTLKESIIKKLKDKLNGSK